MSKTLRNALLGAAAIAGVAAWALAPRSFNDQRRNYVPSIPDVWYAHRGLHDAGSGLVDADDLADYHGDNPASARMDATSASIAENGAYVALARRMAMKAGYGHPGVEGPIAPENSLAAFAAACEAGYGIELDVQLTADGQVVVVHDSDLMRVAGDPRRIEDLTYDELTRIPLFPGPSSRPGDLKAAPLPGSQERPPLVVTPSVAPSGYHQHVPLFADVLKTVAGRVPIIVEYKFDDNRTWDERDEELMEKGHALLAAYQGAYVVESFHPGAMNWYRDHHPETCRGQLSWPAPMQVRPNGSGGGEGGPLPWLAGLLAFDWLSRPDFVAYDWTGGPLPQVRLARAMGAATVSWTVRSSDELAESERYFDHHIFEAFVPDAR